MQILFFFFFVIQHLRFSFINGGILSEQEVLLAIKSAITDDPDNSLSSWKNTTHHCTWSFVTCSSSSHSPTIISLDISDLELNGTLSPHIGFLTNLQKLSLDYNSFFGHVPSSLSLLTKLRYLSLESNKLSGPLPLSVVNMSELWYLSLDYNYFSDTISSEFGKLQKLQVLYLNNNNISGLIPYELGFLKSLKELDLSINQLQGFIPELIGDLPKLEILRLRGNNFTGSIPQKLGTNGKLSYLDVSSNNLSGPIRESLGSCMALIFLNLTNNQLTGHLPVNIGNLTSLRYLLVANNNLIGKITPTIRGYNITNHQNSSICNLAELVILDLSYNKFHGEVPHCLGNASTELVVLNLQSNNFKGIIPSSFFTFDSLEYVDFSNNQLEGVVPRSLSYCFHLRFLNLGYNKFKDVFPYWLDSLDSLQVLSLPFNKFYGEIANNLTKIATFPFSNLKILDLSNNNLCGTLPFMYIKKFQAMMDLDVSPIRRPTYLENEVTSYMFSIKMVVKGIELEYKKIITSMSTFDVSNNHFHGEIPKSIGILGALRNLNLSHNLFTREIPLTIKNLTLLDGLDLSSNRLTGEIPQELVGLIFLEVFNVSYNQLIGLIPHGNNFDTFPSDSYKGNLGLCGVPLLECNNNTIVPSLNNDNVEEKTELSMWEVVEIGFGSGIIVGLAWGYYILSVGRPFWLFKLLIKM